MNRVSISKKKELAQVSNKIPDRPAFKKKQKQRNEAQKETAHGKIFL